MRSPIGVKLVIPCCREKPLAMYVYGPYPKPTQVVRLKILRRSGELWLRNSAKCPRNFGRRGTIPVNQTLLWDVLVVVAEAREKRLFTKNTGPCEDVSRCIRTDACPVLEG